MTDPTPEESEIFNLWAAENDACSDTDQEAECFLRWSRAAVEAERERYSKFEDQVCMLVSLLRSVVMSGEQWSSTCEDEFNKYLTLRAAIRKEPDADFNENLGDA